MNNAKEIIVILGGGMVGLSIAHQLRKRNKRIYIIDKEYQIGLHTSGRNSGVIHAGLYYKPDSIKAKVCVEGGKRLKAWINNKGLNLNKCGKVIVPQKKELDGQLEILEERGKLNGASVNLISEGSLNKLIPGARTATGRALWSPDTAVINSKEVLLALKEELVDNGVTFLLGEDNYKIDTEKNMVKLKECTVNYDYIYNCTGLHADRTAHKLGIGKDYEIMPFKGLYWKIKDKSKLMVKRNLYPVPDLSMPFLGVHFTPNYNNSVVNIGPTATPTMGRENYRGLEKVEPILTIKNFSRMALQYAQNKNRFRNYAHNQSILAIKKFMLRSAQELIPSIQAEDVEISHKCGIRPQLYNIKKGRLEDDFIYEQTKNSFHVLNSISPAFTASFELADKIIKLSGVI